VIGAWACFHIPDIFVEVDWMEGHEMSDEAVAKVAWAFARHGIALHIDRGEMGGGGQVTHEDPVTHDMNILSDPWEDKFQNNPAYFDPDRFHIFHYCMMAHRILYDGSTDRSGVGGGDSFTVAEEVIPGWPLYDYNTALAGTFMHELGHTLGLGFQDGWNHGNGCPSGYRSCMNYDYQFSLVDYHDGAGGFYNDWGNLDYVI